MNDPGKYEESDILYQEVQHCGNHPALPQGNSATVPVVRPDYPHKVADRLQGGRHSAPHDCQPYATSPIILRPVHFRSVIANPVTLQGIMAGIFCAEIRLHAQVAGTAGHRAQKPLWAASDILPRLHGGWARVNPTYSSMP